MATPDEPKFLARACDATRILNKRRQLFDIKERYAAERAQYDERCKMLEQKDVELKKRDLEFQAKVGLKANTSSYISICVNNFLLICICMLCITKLVRFEIFTKENESKQKKLARR